METPAHAIRKRRKLKLGIFAFVLLFIGVVGCISVFKNSAAASEDRKAKLLLLSAYKQTNLPKGRTIKGLQTTLEHAGTNRLAILKSMLQVQNNTFRDWLIPLLRKQKVFPINLHTAQDHLKCAILFSRMSGSEARELIPELTALMVHPNRGISLDATLALKDLRPHSNASLIQGLTNLDLEVRWLCVQGLRPMPAEAAIAVPFIVDCIGQPFPELPEAALETLGRLKLYPEICIPPMIAKLEDPKVSIQMAAAEALAQFGPRATNAVPALIKIIELNSATFPLAPFKIALKSISPEAYKRFTKN